MYTHNMKEHTERGLGVRQHASAVAVPLYIIWRHIRMSPYGYNIIDIEICTYIHIYIYIYIYIHICIC